MAKECQVTGQLPCKQKHVMKYKADISLEQRQAVLAALLEIGDINIISMFMPVFHGSDLERQASQKWW